MLKLIFGPDTFTVRERLREALTQNQRADSLSEAAQWLDGRTVTPREISEAAGQTSMFVTARIVVVEGLLARFSKRGARVKTRGSKKRSQNDAGLGEWRGFSAIVSSLPPSSTLILIDAEVTESNPLLRELIPVAAETIRCSALTGRQLVQWINGRALSQESRIEPAAVSRLAAIVGPDLWLMQSELEKLMVYADGGPITAAMVNDMAAAAPAPTIFALVDAIVERNAPQARRRLDDLYNRGLSSGYVFTLVARQLRLIAQAHEIRGRRGQLSGELAGLPLFALERTKRQAQRQSEAATRAALLCVLAADRAIKTGLLTDRMALDTLITDITTSAVG